MTKEECFRLFRETGKICYYLEYKRLSRNRDDLEGLWDSFE